MLRTLGAYDLEGEIGRGGMGRVFRARHRPTGAVRALKLIEVGSDPEALERFRRESELLARVGQGVVKVHDVGAERGVAWYVMDLVPGGSLRDRLRAEGKLAWRDAATIVAELARTLVRCHALGAIHRDLKPENVLFDEGGRPLIADFGLARDLSARALTMTGTSVGTPGYMAPEQLEAKDAGPAADVFALGVVLYELVTGVRPYDGRVAHEVAVKAVREERMPASAFAEVPPALEATIARCLAPGPANRIEAAALAAALDRLVAGDSASARPTSARRAIALGLGLVVLAGVVALVLHARTGPATPPPTPPSPPPPPSVADLRKWLADKLDRAAHFEAADLERLAAGPDSEALLERALLAPVATGTDTESLARAHPASRVLAVLAAREALAARDLETGRKLLSGVDHPLARQLATAIAATTSAGAMLVDALDAGRGDADLGTLGRAHGALLSVARERTLRAALPGVIGPLDGAAHRFANRQAYNPDPTASLGLEKARLAEQLLRVGDGLPGEPDAVFLIADVWLRDDPRFRSSRSELDLAACLALGRAGVRVVAREPLLGGALVHAATTQLAYLGPECPVELAIEWLATAVAGEARARAAATPSDAVAFKMLYRWLHGNRASFLERRAVTGALAARLAGLKEALAERLTIHASGQAIDEGHARDSYDVARLLLEVDLEATPAWVARHRTANVNVLCAEFLRRRGAFEAALALVSPTPSEPLDCEGSASVVARILHDLGRRDEARRVFEEINWRTGASFSLLGFDRGAIEALLAR